MTPEAAVRQYAATRAPHVQWRRLLREIGGPDHLAAVLDDEGRPDPERLDPLLTSITWRLIGKGKIRADFTDLVPVRRPQRAQGAA